MAVAVESPGAVTQKPAAPAAIMPWAMMENERSAHGGCASFCGRVFSGIIPVMPGVGGFFSNRARFDKTNLR
jgi:hypothetical protein